MESIARINTILAEVSKCIKGRESWGLQHGLVLLQERTTLKETAELWHCERDPGSCKDPSRTRESTTKRRPQCQQEPFPAPTL